MPPKRGGHMARMPEAHIRNQLYTGTKPEKTAFVQVETDCHAEVNNASQVFWWQDQDC
jgi:hypothetical protein